MKALASKESVRAIVADAVSKRHGNREFVRQIREGEQDDGPFMQGAFAVASWAASHTEPAKSA